MKKTSKKKTPKRMCLVCREMFDKKDLRRVVRSPEGEIDFDPTGKKPGKGAYICTDPACFKKMQKGGFLERALKTKVPIEVYEKLEANLIDGK